MHPAVTALLTRDRPVEPHEWRSLWEGLRDGTLRRGESVALLASLATRMPCRTGLTGLLDSLAERRPQPPSGAFRDAVNIVGTGGGPRTLNLSTAAAFVAAAMGVRVVKTGSRAHTSALGSHDLLDRLGIATTTSYDQTLDTLDRCGLAFPGAFVYPEEIVWLARSVLPMDFRRLGRFVNAMGPFLADMPVAAQLTGVSDPRLHTGLRHAAAHTAHRTGRTVWLCGNDAGADELLGFAPNRLHTFAKGSEDAFTLDPAALGLRGGGLADLRPGPDPVAGFRALLAGDGHPAAEDTVCLNAAALAVAAHATGDWPEALRAARSALRDGAALALLGRLCATAPAPA
ncbi:anthranilate phosphoribosyltransferase [Streptomyces sp. S186]|uniref:anthranilate phosphoribosyltransferase n=1 Tax=Streptomyces sp. S186 TaxID=3434395 RepID=UPI003F67FAD7